MLPFTENLKLYLFKNKHQVSLSVKVSDTCVNSYNLSTHEFEKILEVWDKEGFDGIASGNWWSVCHKKTTPRPESLPTSYVRLSVSVNGQTFHHRVEYLDMSKLEKDYFYQKNNKMYWD